MILYHYTKSEKLNKIMSEGLIPNGLGIVYLTPDYKKLKGFGDTLLEVETGDLKLTCFDDCSDWEVLCWGKILPENIKQIK